MTGGDKLDNFLDSRAYRYMEWCYRLMVLNTFFIITSIPVLSIGASSTSLFTIINRLRRGEEFYWRDYFTCFKENFIPATKVWLIILSFIIIITINFMNIGIINPLLSIIQFYIGFQIILIAIYSFKLISKFELSTLQAIKNSWIIGNRFLGHSIGVILVFYGMLKLGMRMPVIMMFFYFSLTHIILDALIEYTVKKINIYRDEVA